MNPTPSPITSGEALKALAALKERVDLIHNLCMGLSPKQSVGELLAVTLTMPEWDQLRAALATASAASAPVAQSERDACPANLRPDDLAALKRFHECATDFDSGGHDVPKYMMARLCEIGVMQSLGFGRHQTTSFGDYVLERDEGEPVRLPLMTLAERNAASAAIAAQQPAEGGEA